MPHRPEAERQQKEQNKGVIDHVIHVYQYVLCQFLRLLLTKWKSVNWSMYMYQHFSPLQPYKVLQRLVYVVAGLEVISLDIR